jgi:hypothetical protein
MKKFKRNYFKVSITYKTREIPFGEGNIGGQEEFRKCKIEDISFYCVYVRGSVDKVFKFRYNI